MAMKKRELTGRVLRWPDAMNWAGVGQTRLGEMIADGAFPQPFKISDNGRNVVFLKEEVEAWLAARVAARDTEQAPKRKGKAG
jgi:predicted DNA-binding transcriptional regulator AlpA